MLAILAYCTNRGRAQRAAGRRASARSRQRRGYPAFRVVDGDDVLNAGGVTSGIDLALHLGERERVATAAWPSAR